MNGSQKVLILTLMTLIFTFDQLSLDVTTKKQFPLSSASKSLIVQTLASVVVITVVVGSSVVVITVDFRYSKV
jgi:hypothetical protein